MSKSHSNDNIPMYNDILKLLSKTTEDYLFFWDIENNTFNISPHALEEFDFAPDYETNIKQTLINIIHPNDASVIIDTIFSLADNHKEFNELEFRMINKADENVWVNFRCTVQQKENNTSKFMFGCIKNMGVRNRADSLTGLLGEVQFKKDMLDILEPTKSSSGILIIIGVDNFKYINDKYGQNYGDYILKNISKAIEGAILGSGKIYRLTGDKFSVLLQNATARQATSLFSKIKHNIDILNEKNKTNLVLCTVSAGVVSFPEHSTSYDELYKFAESSLNVAKDLGKNCIIMFNKDLYKNHIRRIDIQEYMVDIVKNNCVDLELHYQPLISSKDYSVIGCEALLRLNTKKYGNISPVEFIPILEESGLIINVGKWILETAISQCSEWQEYVKDFKMSINVSHIQLTDPSFNSYLTQCLSKHNVGPHSIILEITESGWLQNLSTVNQYLSLYNGMGIDVAIDDFGTGYSSLSYLKELNVNIVKIDRSFVNRILESDYDFKFIKYIIELAQTINLKVCVEGVETIQEVNALNALCPDYIQGYLFGKPENKINFYEKFICNKPDVKKSDAPNNIRSNKTEYRPANKEIYFQTLSDNIPGGIVILKRDDYLSVIYANDGFYNILGYTRASFRDKCDNKILRVLCTEDIYYILESLNSQLNEGNKFYIETRTIKENGEIIWISINGTFIKHDGKSEELHCVIVDISLQKNMAIELENITNNLTVGVINILCNKNLNITYANDGYYKILGYTSECDFEKYSQNKNVKCIFPGDLEFVKSSLEKQMNCDDSVVLEHRMVKKNGEIIWVILRGKFVLDKDGVECINCVVVENTESHQIFHDLKMAEERNRIVLEQSDDIVSEYDIKNKGIHHTENFEKNFNLPCVIPNFPECILDKDYIYKDDIQNVIRMFNRIRSGNVKHDQCEYRHKVPSGEYIWFKHICTVIFNENNEPIKAIGRTTNINNAKKEINALKHLASTDSLTQLFNKVSTQNAIIDYIKTFNKNAKEFGALMMIDIDDFKAINDTLGHKFGDDVLTDISNQIKTHFRESDVLGRVGGDEFIIFLKDLNSMDVVHSKAEHIVDIFRNSYSGENRDYKVSGSIGIALFPLHGDTFGELYKSADIALYESKKSGKDRYTLFSK